MQIFPHSVAAAGKVYVDNQMYIHIYIEPNKKFIVIHLFTDRHGCVLLCIAVNFTARGCNEILPFIHSRVTPPLHELHAPRLTLTPPLRSLIAPPLTQRVYFPTPIRCYRLILTGVTGPSVLGIVDRELVFTHGGSPGVCDTQVVYCIHNSGRQ